MANKSGLNRETDFVNIYEGDDVIKALSSIKSTGNEYSTIVLLCTSA